MRGTARQFEHDATEDVDVQDLLSLAFLEGLAPVGRGELEDAVDGPAGHQAEQVAHVREGLDLVEAAAARSNTKAALISPPSSLPTKSQFLRLCRAFHKRNYAA